MWVCRAGGRGGERPEAPALLTAAADPGLEFDAVVVDEYERAFHGDQFREVVSKLNALGCCGVAAGGRVVRSSSVVLCTKPSWCCWARRRSVRWRGLLRATG